VQLDCWISINSLHYHSKSCQYFLRKIRSVLVQELTNGLVCPWGVADELLMCCCVGGCVGVFIVVSVS
jgi:hypothetical protein